MTDPAIYAAISSDPVGTYRKHRGDHDAKLLSQLPAHMHEGLAGYVLAGIPVGGFLTAVLHNDLFRAVSKADDANGARLRDYAIFLHCAAPAGCFGNAMKVRDWINDGGLLGILAAEGGEGC